MLQFREIRQIFSKVQKRNSLYCRFADNLPGMLLAIRMASYKWLSYKWLKENYMKMFLWAILGTAVAGAAFWFVTSTATSPPIHCRF